MLSKKEIKILERLKDSDFVTSKEIDEILGVSNKTARKMIASLSDTLSSCGAEILSKSSKGYYLQINDHEAFDQLMKNREIGFNDSDSRWEYMVKLFIEEDSYLKIDDLSERLYTSQKVISNSIKKAEEFLNHYHLYLERKPHHGIRLEGEEEDKRRCMSAIAKANHFVEIDSRLETIVNYIFINYNVTMSKAARESFLIHLQYSLSRIQKGKQICYGDEAAEYINEDFFKDSLIVANEIANMMEDEFAVEISKDERYSVALHVSDKKYYEKETGNIVIDKEVAALTDNLLRSIKETYGLDFENDLDIYAMLIKHLIPLRMRIENGSDLRNPILDDIKNQYPFAMTIAKGINPIIEEHFHSKISEDELSYIAIALQLAIERNKTSDKRKKNVVIICPSGSVSSRLFEHRFKEMFKDSVGSTKICSYNEVIDYDFSDVDYVFATVPIDIQLPIPMYQMSDQVLTQRETREIQQALDLSSNQLISKFAKELFMPHVIASDKNELLKLMCDKARSERELPDDFCDLVMKRERMLNTSYGNGVALPHPYRTVAKTPFVVTALLDKPIYWNEEDKVNAVFLVAISESMKDDLTDFYEDFFEFVLDKEIVTRLLENQTFETLIDLLKKQK
ncbi:MAG: BglG family transcription antiterminator [Erysipelotrichaceae bacterium]|nr:BglG family transcription antiterminator [Erysipelotrichaceae bacterium]